MVLNVITIAKNMRKFSHRNFSTPRIDCAAIETDMPENNLIIPGKWVRVTKITKYNLSSDES
jgi:hypothetical protein